MSEATPPGQTPPGEAQPDEAALAGQQRLQEQVVRTGMFGTETSGDTSGYGGLQVRRAPLPSTPRPYGCLRRDHRRAGHRLEASGSDFCDAVERVIVDRGELTLHVRPEHLVEVARLLRDERPSASSCAAACSRCTTADTGRELHAVYDLLSITHNRRIRLEVSVAGRRPAHPVPGRSAPL